MQQRLFTGTAAIARDLAWFRRHAEGHDVTLTDTTETYAQISLMGPDAARIVATCGAPELNDLGFFKVGPAHIAGKHIRAARMSYVGEAGGEITMKAENAAPIVEALQAEGAKLAGLYAQTSMRIEKGFRALGHELDSDVTPLDVGLDGVVSKKRSFIGSDALAEKRVHTPTKQVATLIFADQDATPLGHEPVWAGGKIIGQTTSAAYGHRIGAPIALAYVIATEASEVEVDIAGVRWPARLQTEAAFDSTGARMKA